jgi:hypothetical protein
MVEPYENVARGNPSPSDVAQPAFPQCGILQLDVTHRPIFDRAFFPRSRSLLRRCQVRRIATRLGQQKNIVQTTSYMEETTSSTNDTDSLSWKLVAVQPLPKPDTKTVADAIEAATRTVVATTTMTTELYCY